MNKFFYILLLISTAATMPMKATEPEVKLSIDAPEKVEVGERFWIRYTIETSGEIGSAKPDIELGKDVQVLLGPSVSISRSVTQGVDGMEQNITQVYTYMGIIEKGGTYRLPAFGLTIEGKTYKSERHTIKVTGSSKPEKEQSISRAKQRGGDAANAEIKAFVRTNVSKQSVSPGDTLSVTYLLYSTHEPRLITSGGFPAIREFETYRFNARTDVGEEVIDGTRYKVYNLQKLILSPVSEGNKNIPGGNITIEYAIPTGRTRINSWGNESEEYISRQLELNVDGATVTVMKTIAV